MKFEVDKELFPFENHFLKTDAGVATLVDGQRRPGNYTVHWNVTGYPSGIYMYRFQVGTYGKTKRLTLLE